jgi:cysteine-rich repeat protein
MSWSRALPCLLAGVAIGCGTHTLEPSTDAGGDGGGMASDAGANLDGGVSPVDASDAPFVAEIPTWIAPCGNGRLDTDEECDNGDTIPGDGCGATCQIECHWSCGTCGTPGPCIVSPACGDGLIVSGEGCDDSNTTGGDGCSARCSVEPGWLCPVAGRRCFPICGDGRTIGPETCDDHNTIAGDGCSALCLVEPSDARCGDGVMSGAEQCDDGTAADTGYGRCAADCRFAAYCGDGAVNGPEQCDLGTAQNVSTYGSMDGCAPGCLYPHFCGDAVVDSDEGEQCDLGALNGTHGSGSYAPCATVCKILIDEQ